MYTSKYTDFEIKPSKDTDFKHKTTKIDIQTLVQKILIQE